MCYRSPLQFICNMYRFESEEGSTESWNWNLLPCDAGKNKKIPCKIPKNVPQHLVTDTIILSNR